MQKIREGTKHQGYRICIPKSIIESKGWDNTEFELKDLGDRLNLIAIKNS